MSVAGVLLVFLSALLTAVANLLLRQGILSVGGFSGPEPVQHHVLVLLRNASFVGGVLLYGLAALVWFRVLPMEKLSNSYPMLVALTFLMVTVGAVLVFRESVSPQKVLGLAVILAGILLVSRA